LLEPWETLVTTPPKPMDTPPEATPYISPPPPKADVDQVSREQTLITDEWAPETEETPPDA